MQTLLGRFLNSTVLICPKIHANLGLLYYNDVVHHSKRQWGKTHCDFRRTGVIIIRTKDGAKISLLR